MTDLEQRLRSEFREEVDRLGPSVPDGAPRGLTRRVRARQAATMMSATVIAAAVAGFTLLAREALDDHPAVRPAESPPASDVSLSPPLDSFPDVPDEAIVLVSGEVKGGRWELVTFKWDLVTSEPHVGEWCLGERFHQESGPGGYGCGFGFPFHHLRLRTAHSSDYPTLVGGAVSQQVDAVRIELDSGEVIEPEIVEPPEGAGVPFNAFGLLIEGVAPDGRVLVLSEDGTILDSERLPPPPDPSELPNRGAGWSSGTGP